MRRRPFIEEAITVAAALLVLAVFYFGVLAMISSLES